MARGELAAWSANSGEGPTRRRWGKTAISSLPRQNWHDSGVEEVEGNTARLWVSWAMRFCQDAGARRGRRSGWQWRTASVLRAVGGER